MKLILLSTLLLFILAQSYAQGQMSISPTIVDTSFDHRTFDPVGKSIVKNEGIDSLTLLWKYEKINVPDTWLAYFYDKNLGYSPEIKECPEDIPVQLEPGEQGNLDLHILPNQVYDCGRYLLTVWEKEYPENKIEVPYNFNCATSTGDVTMANVVLLPNPSFDSFRFSEQVSASILIITDLYGNQVKQYEIQSDKIYSIEDLPSGSYTVNVFTEKGEMVKTGTLQKLLVKF